MKYKKNYEERHLKSLLLLTLFAATLGTARRLFVDLD
jgi:hypothetical protein